MRVFEPVVTPETLSQLHERIKLQTGDSQKPHVMEKLRKPLKAAIEIVEKEVKPRALFDTLPIRSSDQKVIKTRAGLIQSPMLCTLVNRCSRDRQLVFMVVTIGDDLERKSRSEPEMLDRWVYDMVGSELVDIVADQAEREFTCATSPNELEYSMRSSPGYCDWPLDGQRVIFNALNTGKINVTLTPHMLMIPRKTLSGVLVAAEKVPIKFSCLLCAKNNCPWRRGGQPSVHSLN
jgi:hypothetical protein